MSNIKEEVNVIDLYGKESNLKKEEFLKKFNIEESGLTTNEAKNRIEKFGLNGIIIFSLVCLVHLIVFY